MNDVIKAFLKSVIPAKFLPPVEAFRRAALTMYCRGSKYTCPICGTHLRRFLPDGHRFAVLTEKQVIGGGYFPNRRCPACKANERDRLVYLYLLHKTDVFQKPRKILHFAPENGLSNHLSKLAGTEYLTADLNANGVMVKVDVTNMQFADDFFDVIICNHVLEHVPDDRKAMREIYRTLTPNGWAILQVPISLALANTYEDFSITTARGREQAFGQSDHVRIYARDYASRLKQSGFKVEVFQWTAEIDNFGTRKNVFALNEKEAIYRVTKAPSE